MLLLVFVSHDLSFPCASCTAGHSTCREQCDIDADEGQQQGHRNPFQPLVSCCAWPARLHRCMRVPAYRSNQYKHVEHSPRFAAGRDIHMCCIWGTELKMLHGFQPSCKACLSLAASPDLPEKTSLNEASGPHWPAVPAYSHPDDFHYAYLLC